MTPALLASIKSTIESAEGRIPWLYRDSAVAGNATIGVGHLVSSFEAAQSLPFNPPITRSEWDALMSIPANLTASHYCHVTRGRLSDAAIDALLESDIDAVVKRLRARWANFDAFPDTAQAALIDMAYNLGMHGLLLFTHLCLAVSAGAWSAAAKECRRRGISDARNERTAALFMEGERA